MPKQARQTRENRTITVDFQHEATYFQLLGDGKAFLEFVFAFLLSLGFQLKHKATCRGGGCLTRHSHYVRVRQEHSVILTAQRDSFYNRGKLNYHPIGKDSRWAVQRLSRYPRCAQAPSGSGCAMNSTVALTSGSFGVKSSVPIRKRHQHWVLWLCVS